MNIYGNITKFASLFKFKSQQNSNKKMPIKNLNTQNLNQKFSNPSPFISFIDKKN